MEVQQNTRVAKHHLFIGIGIALLVVSALIRIWSYPVVSGDYVTSLSHWMDALRGASGLTAFAKPFSDYPPLYLYVLKFLTLLPGFDLYWIKAFSILFDLIMATGVYVLVRYSVDPPRSRSYGFFAFAVAFTIPTVMLNSALWGQCDGIYATFVLLSLYFMLRNKPYSATFAFAIAISLKLQAIFFLPVFLGYIFSRPGRVVNIITIPLVYVVTLIPALLAGGSFGNLFFTYLRQAGEFQSLTLSAPSMFAFFGNVPQGSVLYYGLTGVGYVIAVIAVITIIIQSRRLFHSEFSGQRLLFLSLMSVLIIPFFLPHMHERYFYLADVISVTYALCVPRRWYVPVVIVVCSFFSYMSFLSGAVTAFGKLIINEGILAAALLILIISLLPRFFSVVRKRQVETIRPMV